LTLALASDSILKTMVKFFEPQSFELGTFLWTTWYIRFYDPDLTFLVISAD